VPQLEFVIVPRHKYTNDSTRPGRRSACQADCPRRRRLGRSQFEREGSRVVVPRGPKARLTSAGKWYPGHPLIVGGIRRSRTRTAHNPQRGLEGPSRSGPPAVGQLNQAVLGLPPDCRQNILPPLEWYISAPLVCCQIILIKKRSSMCKAQVIVDKATRRYRRKMDRSFTHLDLRDR